MLVTTKVKVVCFYKKMMTMKSFQFSTDYDLLNFYRGFKVDGQTRVGSYLMMYSYSSQVRIY